MSDPHFQPDPPGIRLGPGVHVPESVLRFSYASSTGPGGQNVNKRLTKAILRVRATDLPLTPGAQQRLRKLGSRWMTDDGELVIAADEFRSQSRNREACLERLRELVAQARTPPKPRRKTAVPQSAIRKRLEAKSRRSETKRRRGAPGDE
ncbi:MAG: aminoacyl-tRNA hydrolase [Phycisphaeraceae bacterium]|nr:aminoacyl-tRNA hydrolase [Phycisphaeraceae bacterium]MCW5755041.1 aminoacyl-tRNA hydrolase [Phycisphaeraceae bacterium]